MIRACRGQLRMGMGGPIGLDFPAVIEFANLGGPMRTPCATLLGEVLPEVESRLMASFRKDEE